jgi:hypothetical protein
MNYLSNISRIKVIANAFKDIKNEVIFVGGAVVSLYCKDPELIHLRITDDVDVVIEIKSYGMYMHLQEKLRELEFNEDNESQVICRWKYKGIIVDIMPNDPDILGFSNSWYKEGGLYKEKFDLDADTSIYILPSLYFLATKFEALKNRDGGVDWRWSQDFEDIIKLLLEIEISFIGYDDKIKTFIVQSMKEIIADKKYFYECCEGHLVRPFYSENDYTRVYDKIVKSII